jgi:cobalt-zinc-cadmium efflux system membrane fusion protein
MRNAMVGQQAGPADDLFEIVDASSVTVEGSVFEADFPGLRTGQRASFESHAFAEERFQGALSFVASSVDERTHALAVRMRVPNPRASLKPNMHGRLVINADLPRTVVSVPTDAIVYDGNNRFVFVAMNDSTFRYVRVETGAEFGDRVEIRSGLRAGERVVQSGVFNLKSQLKMSQAGDE